MNFTKDEIREKQPPKKSGVIAALLLVIAIIAVSFTVYLNSRDFDLSASGFSRFLSVFSDTEAGGEEVKPMELPFEDNMRTTYCVYKDYFAKCTTDGVKLMDKEGKEVWSVGTALVSPIVKTNGANILVADIGGKYISVFDNRGVKWEKKADGNIINADISESGYVTVVREKKGYKASVRVYDAFGNEKFDRDIGKDHVINAAVAPSGEQLVLLKLETAGITARPSLQFLDIKGSDFAARTPEEEGIFAAATYFDDDSLLVSSDTTVVFYDNQREEKWRGEFERVFSIAAASGRNSVIAYQEKGGQGIFESAGTYIGFFNARGQKTAECRLEGEVRNIRCHSGVVAVNMLREVYFINSSGKIIGKYTAKSDIDDIGFFSKAEAAVFTKNSVVITRTSSN